MLKGVAIEVEKGDVVVILGPSGSGKTTLLRSINFLERADSGTLDWGDLHVDLKHASGKEVSLIRKKNGIGPSNSCDASCRIMIMPSKYSGFMHRRLQKQGVFVIEISYNN